MQFACMRNFLFFIEEKKTNKKKTNKTKNNNFLIYLGLLYFQLELDALERI